jgi:multiple sugar transport system ATP-binding protein
MFGIRPEDIHNPEFIPPGIAKEDVATIDASVDVTELMGNEIFLYLASGEKIFVARVDPRSRYSIGDKVQVAFNMDKMHVFDVAADTENPPAIR